MWEMCYSDSWEGIEANGGLVFSALRLYDFAEILNYLRYTWTESYIP